MDLLAVPHPEGAPEAEGAVEVMRTCYNNGIWAIYSALDPRALQFKPGILLDRTLCDDILNRLETAVGQARAALFRTRTSSRRTDAKAA